MTTKEYYDIKPSESGWRQLVNGHYIKLGKNLSIDHVSFGANVTVGDNTYIESESCIGDNVFIGSNVTIKCNANIGKFSNIGSNVRIGSYTNIGTDVNIGNNSHIGHDVYIKNNVEIKMQVNIGDNSCIRENAVICSNAIISKDVTIGFSTIINEFQTTEGLNEYFISTYPQKSIFWKFVTSKLMSPGWGSASPIQYEIGKIVKEPTAKKSDKQCDKGLHVFRPGIRPEFVGLNQSGENLVCLEVEVDRKDICFGGLPGNCDKLRVKKLKVLRELPIKKI